MLLKLSWCQYAFSEMAGKLTHLWQIEWPANILMLHQG
jgi:hypothetical protein